MLKLMKNDEKERKCVAEPRRGQHHGLRGKKCFIGKEGVGNETSEALPCCCRERNLNSNSEELNKKR